jgi:hypothetical protein
MKVEALLIIDKRWRVFPLPLKDKRATRERRPAKEVDRKTSGLPSADGHDESKESGESWILKDIDSYTLHRSFGLIIL